MKCIIHRGSKEIGGSCVELISDAGRILLDLGLPLDAGKNDVKYLPDISGLDGSDKSLLAVIISHPHMDHFGLLAHISDQIPVIMGINARRILTRAAPFFSDMWPVPNPGFDLTSEKLLNIGPFTITPYLIDHSAYDSYSLLIEADGKRIFYSGDFRMHGRKSKLTEKLINNPPLNIDILLLEGSSIGRINVQEAFPTERDIENKLVAKLKDSKGLTLIHTSAQNIDRVVSIFRACKRTNKILVIDLYTAVILEATGNKNIPQSDWPNIALYVPQSQRIQILKNKWFDLLKEHSRNRIFIDSLKALSQNYVMLFRPIHMRDLEKADLLNNAEYIYSQWEGYWERDSNENLRNWLLANKIPKTSIHTSGHASIQDLKRLAEALKPGKIVPIHTFEPNEYRTLFSNVELHSDGEVWEI